MQPSEWLLSEAVYWGLAIAVAVCRMKSRSLSVLKGGKPGLGVCWSQRCLEALLYLGLERRKKGDCISLDFKHLGANTIEMASSVGRKV